MHDNLAPLAAANAALLPLPSYASVCRYMKQHGLMKARRPRRHEQDPSFVPREKRSFEVRHTHALWHTDFHDGKRNVLLPTGEWKRPVLLAIMDDHSRLCCHTEGRAAYRERTVVEHRLARVDVVQGKRARYEGVRKNEIDVNRAVAVVNLQEIARLRCAA